MIGKRVDCCFEQGSVECLLQTQPTHTDLSGFGVYIDERRRVGSTDNWYE